MFLVFEKISGFLSEQIGILKHYSMAGIRQKKQRELGKATYNLIGLTMGTNKSFLPATINVLVETFLARRMQLNQVVPIQARRLALQQMLLVKAGDHDLLFLLRCVQMLLYLIVCFVQIVQIRIAEIALADPN